MIEAIEALGMCMALYVGLAFVAVMLSWAWYELSR